MDCGRAMQDVILLQKYAPGIISKQIEPETTRLHYVHINTSLLKTF